MLPEVPREAVRPIAVEGPLAVAEAAWLLAVVEPAQVSCFALARQVVSIFARARWAVDDLSLYWILHRSISA